MLLAHVLDKPRAWILAHPEASLTSEQQQRLEQATERLQSGEPLPYILGHWEFFGLDFIVAPAVLIPRPETELLVEHALDWLRSHPAARLAADIGTGSGCIAIGLAAHCPHLHVLATDLSTSALEIARQNALKHSLAERIDLIQADLIDPSIVERSRVDLIVANLPYIPTETLPKLAVYQKEPTLALDGGVDGLDLVRRLLKQAPACLAPGGLMLLEIEHRQGPSVKELAQAAFPHARVAVLQDLAGHDRVVRISN